MVKYVPEYILASYEKGIYQGKFTGYALFFDISGFTRLTEISTFKGQKGAAELNRLLQSTFGPVTAIVEQNGGMITGYAGDSFLAVFEEASEEVLLGAVLEMREYLDAHTQVQKQDKAVILNGRIAVSFGEIRWEIIRNPIQNEYYFWGEAISECCELEKYKKLTLFSEKAAHAIGEDKFTKLEYGCLPNIKRDKVAFEIRKSDHINNPEVNSKFLRKEFISINVDIEFRDVACAFISLSEILEQERGAAIGLLLELSARYGGYFNKLDYSDKGLVAIILFGAPIQEEKVLERLMDFSLETVRKLKEVKLGLTRGKCYAGYTGSETRQEYTILGFTPNLASRLMQTGVQSDILVDKFTEEQLQDKYKFIYQGNIPIKGFLRDLPVYKCVGKKGEKSFIFKSSFVGREQELSLILDAYDKTIHSHTNRVIYVHGEPGIGKSRLIDKFREQLEIDNIITWCFLSCDSILHQAYSPISKFLNSYFKIDQQKSSEDKELNFRQSWKKFSEGNEELEWVESQIANLIGINWKNSLFSQFPAATRPAQQKQALSIFFHHLGNKQPLVINIDDAQWIDHYTREFLEEFTSSQTEEKIFLICSCRYLADGRQVNLNFEKLGKIDIKLNRLRVNSTQKLIQNILQLEYIPQETEQFIIRKSQCNPLFIEQITSYMQEQYLIDEDGFLRANIKFVNAFGIVDIIGARIDHLTEDLRRLVFYASVLGMEFNKKVLQAMLEDDVDQELNDGENNGVWTKISEFEYIFTHILLRDTAYSRMLGKKQKELHQLAATCYEKIFDESEQELYNGIIGFHYEKAGKEITAADYYLKAGKSARRYYRLDEALNLYKKAYDIHQKYSPDNEIQLSDDIHLISVIKCIKMQHKEGIEDLLQVLQVYESIHGVSHEKTLSVYSDLATAYRENRDYINSMVFLNKELEINKARFGESHPSISRSYNRIGLIYFLKADYAKAKLYFEKALEILNSCEEVDDNNRILTLGNLAAIFHVENQLDKALEYNQKIIEINLKRLSPYHYEIGRNYFNLGHILTAMKRYEEAEACFLKAMRIQINVTGANHPRLAAIYGSLGNIYLNLQNYQQAMIYGKKALAITENRLEDKHPDTANYLSLISNIYLEMGELALAFEAGKRSLAIREEELGLENPFTAESWHNMALYYIKTGDNSQALEFLEKSMQLFSSLYGEKHTLTAGIKKNMAEVYFSLENYSEAQKYFLDCLSCDEFCNYMKSKDTASIYFHLSKCNIYLKNYNQAEKYLLKSQEYYINDNADIEKKKEIKRLLRTIR